MRLGGVNLFGHAMFGALLNTVRPMSRIKYVVAASQHPGDVTAGWMLGSDTVYSTLH